MLIIFIFFVNILLIHYKFTWCLANLATQLKIHFLFHVFTIYFPTLHQFTIFLANSPWFHYLFREFTMNLLSFSRIYYGSTIFFVNSLSFLRIYIGLTIFLRIPYTMNSLFFFANQLWIDFVFKEFTIDNAYIQMNSLSISRIF